VVILEAGYRTHDLIAVIRLKESATEYRTKKLISVYRLQDL